MKTALSLLFVTALAPAVLADVAPIQLSTPEPAASPTPAAVATGAPASSPAATATPDPNRIAVSIVQVVPNGPSSVLFLNRGISHDVKIGAKGRIEGIDVEFTVTEAYPTRSKATIAVPADKITKKSASIAKPLPPPAK